MRPFSVASVTATCVSISNRTLATATILDELLAGDDGERYSQLKDAEAFLHRISALATRIQGRLPKCTTITEAVQADLPRRLQACEDGVAVMNKQFMRLPASLELDGTVVRSYDVFLNRQTWIFEEYAAMLEDSPNQQSKQEAVLTSNDWQRRTAKLDQSAAQIMQRSDLLIPEGGDDLPAYTGSEAGAASPPLLTAAGLSPNAPPPTPPSAGGSEKGKGFFSSLSASLQAMTAAMRPKPEPFVIALCQAAMRGDHNQMDGLLQEGANIDGRNEEGLTALICAVNNQRLPTIQWLIQHGAGIAVRDSSGKPPLYRATKVGDVEMVKMLLLYGADPNERNSSGKPFFCEAALTADIDVVKTLLDIGADINARDLTGRNIFIQAISAQNSERVKLFAERGADINSRDINGRNALTIVVNANNMEMAKYLLSKGADPNSRDISGQSVLAAATDRGNVELAKLLLSHGADANVKDNMGVAIFVSVVKRGTLAMAKLFLEHGADANTSFGPIYSRDSETGLLYAITNDKWELAALLLKHGCSANKADTAGRTPLLEAMQRSNARLVQLLLQHGADVNLEGKITPAGFARLGGQRDVLKVLQAHGVPDIYVPPELPAGASRGSNSSRTNSSRTPATLTPRSTVSAGEEDAEAPPDYDSIDHPTRGP